MAIGVEGFGTEFKLCYYNGTGLGVEAIEACKVN